MVDFQLIFYLLGMDIITDDLISQPLFQIHGPPSF